MTILPQAMINVRGVDKLRAGIDTEVQAAVSSVARQLGDNGRVLRQRPRARSPSSGSWSRRPPTRRRRPTRSSWRRR